jgi:hypothetical protein
MSESPLRVIQWATGSVGADVIPAILEDPGPVGDDRRRASQFYVEEEGAL